MKHPQELCAEITAALSIARNFYYGSKPDQNFEADEFSYPAVFLDTPITTRPKNTKSNTRIHEVTLGLFFCQPTEIDDTEPTKFVDAIKVAHAAEREFVLRLRKYDSAIVTDVIAEHITEVDRVFDIHLTGIYAEITILIVDAEGVCLT